MNNAHNNAGQSVPTPRELWARFHGHFDMVAYTELHLPSIDLVIVSTVLLASGTTALEGFFSVYESRTFGLDIGEQVSTLCNHGDTEAGMRVAVNAHILLIREVTGAYAEP